MVAEKLGRRDNVKICREKLKEEDNTSRYKLHLSSLAGIFFILENGCSIIITSICAINVHCSPSLSLFLLQILQYSCKRKIKSTQFHILFSKIIKIKNRKEEDENQSQYWKIGKN